MKKNYEVCKSCNMFYACRTNEGKKLLYYGCIKDESPAKEIGFGEEHVRKIFEGSEISKDCHLRVEQCLQNWNGDEKKV